MLACQLGTIVITSTLIDRVLPRMIVLSPGARARNSRIQRLHVSGTSVADPGFNSTLGIHPSMSFHRKGLGVLASGAIGAAVGIALVGGAIALLSLPAFAQQASRAASSSSTSTVNADIAQTSTGNQVFASTDVYQGQARDVTAASTATANSTAIDNKWGYAEIRGRQTNQSGVYSESCVTLATWNGTAVISSNGVGNSTLATNVGSDMALDVAQQNDGSVLSDAFFQCSGSGDAIVASTAIGNAVTGYVCSQCGDAGLSSTTNQINTGNITSTGTINATTTGQLIGSASAIGNSATFITTSARN